MRTLVETTTMPMREIAARVGVGRTTVVRLTARHGWTRPRPPRLPLAAQRGGGHPVVPEVVEAARLWLEGTALPLSAISARLGVSRTTLCRWRKRRRWQRPEPEGGWPARPVRSRRGRGRPYAGDATGRARDLLTGSILSQAAIAKQIGVSRWAVSSWGRRHGWVRPPAAVARAPASRRTGRLAATGDRRGRPYAPEVRRDARALWELTRLSTRLIGARLGAHPATVARWAREDSWERPHGRAGARQLRGFFGLRRRRG